MTHRPPFRADPVGSLHRHPGLRLAFKAFAGGVIDAAEFRKIQDDSIRAAVHLQEQVGLAVVTDDEFRRSSCASALRHGVSARRDGFHDDRIWSACLGVGWSRHYDGALRT